MGLPSTAFQGVVVVLAPTIFRLLRRWGLHCLPKPGLFTHNWDSARRSTGRRLWGPLLLRDPGRLSLEPQGTSYHVPVNKGLSGGSS